jgi:hypothetical protein
MKRLTKLLGITAIGVVIGIGMMSCPMNEEEEWKGGGGSKPDASELTFNEWTNSQIVQNGEQWFEFTATAGSQYIHVSFGSLTDLYVQLHDSSGNAVGGSTNFYGSSNSGKYVNLSVTSGRVYYLKVRPYSSYSGTYKIAFTASVVTPDEIAAMASAPTLTANTWEQKQLAAGGEHWFKFTATAESQYVHVSFGSLTDLYVQLHDSSGNVVGGSTNFYGSSGQSKYINQLVSNGAVYYLQVWPYSAYSGTYKIAFNTSTTSPANN